MYRFCLPFACLLPLLLFACQPPIPAGVQTVRVQFMQPQDTGAETQLQQTLMKRLDAFYPHPSRVSKVGENDFQIEIAGQIGETALNRLLSTPGKLFFAATYPGPEAMHQLKSAELLDSLAARLQLFDFNLGGDVKRPLIAYASYEDTSSIMNELKRAHLLGIIPDDLAFSWSQVPQINPENQKIFFELFAIQKPDGKYVGVDGAQIQSVQAEQSQYTLHWDLNMRFDEKGTQEWAKMTEERVGDYIAMLIDGKAWSVPRVNSPITGGQTMLSAQFDEDFARLWAAILGGGELPAPLTITSILFDQNARY
ncbi:MAG: hypothetical protein AAFQ68_11895 [Bacteroidota bacterium]